MAELVVVTGASRGVGRATALELSNRGLDVALVGRASDALSKAVADCRTLSVDARAFICDLANSEQIEDACARILQWQTPVALVNNAGCVERAPLEQLTLESYRRQMDTNLLGAVWMAKQLLPSMRAAGRGSIVNVGSISSTLGSASQIPYNTSKWGLIGFTKSLAEELRGSGLMTVTVLPGSIDTDMLKGSGYPPNMQPGDVAKTLVHFALDAPLAHNGASIEMFG